MNTKTPLLLLTFILLFFSSYAQELSTKKIDLKDVLPSSSIFALHQDKNGNIWMGTEGGLCKFDGYDFTLYNQKDGVPGLSVLKLFPQKNGEIWGTCFNKKIFYFKDDFDGIHPYVYNDTLTKKFRSSQQIKSITVDKAGTLHIGGFHIPKFFQIDQNGNYSHGKSTNDILKYFCMLNEHFFTTTTFCDSVKKTTYLTMGQIQDSHIGGIRLNDSTVVFMGTQKIALITNEKTKKIKSDKLPIALRKLTDSSFAVGYYNGGVKFFDEKGEITGHFMKDESVSDILVDKNGGVWFANLYQGIQYVENTNIYWAIKDEFISDLAIDNNNTLFVGCQNGNIFKRNNNQFNDFYIPEKSFSAALFSYNFCTDSFIIYSNSGLVDSVGLFKKKIVYRRALPEYMLEEQHPFRYNTWPFNINDTLLFRKIGQVLEIEKFRNKLYISTNKGGLLVYDGDTLTSFFDETHHLSYSRITDINIPYKGNTFYLCTANQGVYVLKNGNLLHFDEKKGLCSNNVNKVYVENDSNTWVCTNKGLNLITFKKKNQFDIFSLNTEQGIIENNVKDVVILNDTVWAGTKSGLCYFEKNTIFNKKNPELFFTLKKVLQEEDSLHNTVELSYDQNTLSFYLHAISFNRKKDLVYHYRIKEINEKWRKTKNREIIFQDLNPGTYTFEAKVELDGYIPNEIIQFNFSIAPPFWKTWWFYMLYFLAGGLIIYLFFKIRVLTYNKDVVRELMRYLLKRIKHEEHSFVVRANGEDIKILSETVLYIKSAGNYLELHTEKGKHIIRGKISTFIEQTTDPLEYLRIHRSYVIRIDKVTKKGKNWVVINDEKVPVGDSYLEALKGIQF